MSDNANRNYVIVSNEHKSWPAGALLFWGHRTEDQEKRSFGGYTSRIDKCEMYTREELEAYRGDLKQHFPFFDELDITCDRDFRKHNEVCCTIDELRQIGYDVWTVVCRV